MSSSSNYYGWRDIGTGPRGTGGSGVKVIDISGNNNDKRNNNPNPKDFCSTCGCHLIYSDKIKKSFCPEHGCNLTPEERDKLSNKPSSIITTPPDATGSATSPFDDIEPGVGGGFIP